MSDLDKLKDKYDKKEDKASSNVKTTRALTKELEAKKDSAPVRAVKQAVSGFRSQWSGMDEKGNVGIGKGTPGIYYDTVAIPALAGVVDDKYAPEFAVEADKKAGRIKEAIRKDMGIEAPKGALEHFANAGGTMLAQLPVPGAWLGRVLSPVKSAGIAGKVATSPIEYLSPIVDPKKINYGVGTGFGGTIGTVGEMLEEEPTKKELGGLIQKYETGGRVGKAKAFFSAVDKAIDTLKQKKGTGEQILKEIEKAPGVKKEELELRKIREKLKDKKSITQDEVRALATESPAPSINPIIRSRDGVGLPEDWRPSLDPLNQAYLDVLVDPVVDPASGRNLGFLIKESGEIVDYDTLFDMRPEEFGVSKGTYNEMMIAAKKAKQQFDRALSQEDSARSPKFEKYTTPGGENYREILLQLDKPIAQPGALFGGRPRTVSVKEAADYLGMHPEDFNPQSSVLIYPNGMYVERLNDGTYYGLAYNEDKVSANLEDIENFLASRVDQDMLAPGAPDYRSGHFDEPNVLVHARVTDRTGPNGEKVLYVEEIQSDWHQAGRNRGYAGGTVELDKDFKWDKSAQETLDVKEDTPAWVAKDSSGNLVGHYIDEDSAKQALQVANRSNVPDAPFKKTSHELALKQILDMAANEGYDSVAIAPGSEQIKRYNMRQELDSIRALRDDQGKITLSGIKNGRVVIDKLGIDPEDLPNYIGKERSEQILSGMGEDNIFELAGKDLEMTSKEGQGKKKIYDEILPNYLSKYAQKEFGAEPGEIDIFTKQGKSYEQYLDEIVEDPYRYIDEDEYFETIHERVTNRAAQQGYDLEDPDKWDELLSRDTNEADDIWAAVENDFYEEKAKELATKDKGGSLKAFSIPVTPQMREKITGEGQKLFAAAPVVGVQTIPGMEEASQQATPEPEPEVEEQPMPFEGGGKVGKVKSAAKAALKKAKFTEKELEDLAYLIHDKGHLGKKGESIEALDRALKEFSSDAPALYRGAYSSEISGSKMKPGEKLKLSKYSSFSEDPAIARQFGDANVVVELPKGGRGFNYMQQQIENLMDLKQKDPAAFEAVDGDYLIESLKEEAEWIMGSPEVVIKGTRKEGPLTIIESDFIVPEQGPSEFETGGRVGAAKKAIEAAMKKAGQKKGQVAEKDLTTLQDFQTSLGDRINERVRDKMKLMDSFDYSFKPGDRVFTEWSAGNNYAPFEILSKTTTQKRFARDPNTSRIVRDAEGNKVEIEPEPGYLVRHKINFKGEDIDHQYVIPQKNIKGLVEPDEPYKRGGPVGLQDGGRVGKTRAAAEKLLRVLHGGPSSVTPEAGRAMDVTTDSGYAVKRGADKMIGKAGPPMVSKFDIPSGRLLQFEEQYSPEDVALMKRYFNKLPQGQAMKGEEIWDAAQGRDVIMEGIAKAGGFAGYERPNTGAVGKGQWFRVTEPEELKRGKARGGLAQATKPL